MNRDDAIRYVSWGVDNALSPFDVEQITEEQLARATLVGWQCGFEPVFVAVWSYLGGKVYADEAEEIASDWLQERRWFADGFPTPADWVLEP